MLKVSIKSRTKNLFEGAATSISSFNDTGAFDVLLSHANFITLIKQAIFIDKGLASEKKLDITSGVLSCTNDEVSVYLDI